MRAASIKFSMVLTSLFISACSTLPSLPNAEKVNVTDVVNRIQCEMQDTANFLKKYQPDNWSTIKSWLGAFTLKLIAEEGISVAPGIGLAGLPLNFGSLGVATAISAGTVNRRTVNINFVLRLSDLDKFECQPVYYNGYPLISDLGILDWFSRSLMPFEGNDAVAQPTLIGTTLDFVIDTSGRVTPGVALVGASLGSLNYGSLFSGGRKDTNTLEVALKPRVP